jgi:hypothetical protein
MSADKLEKIAVLNDPAEAEVLRGLLEAQGIDVMLSKEAASSVYGLTAGIFAEIEVFVPASKAGEAKKIVDEFFGDSLTNTVEN